MKIYVKGEMPKSCNECEFVYREHSFDRLRCLFSSEHICDNKQCCPLHPVAEREAEVRKEVVEEIGKNVAVETINGKRYARFKDLERILDQVEREIAMKEILNKIADNASVLMVKAQCFDLHNDKKTVLKDMADCIDNAYKLFEKLLEKYKEKSDGDKHNN